VLFGYALTFLADDDDDFDLMVDAPVAFRQTNTFGRSDERGI
jgi:hypothetical protein